MLETEYKSCLCSSGNGSKEEKEMSLSSEVHGNNLTFCTENVIRYENLCKSHEVAPPSSGSGFAKDQQLEINKPEAQERKLLEIVLNRNEDRKSEDLGTRISEELGRGLQGVKNYICERGIMLSSVFGKLLNESEDEVQVLHLKSGKEIFQQQNLEDGKVFQRNGGEQLKGRITFFSRSGCPECCAIRSYFRQRHLPFVEVNIDVYPLRRFEVEERTGSTYVPQIFFNDQLLGGIVALNTLRNSGEFEDKLLRVLRNKCPSTAPAPVVYGIDDPEDETPDELVNIVRIMRLKVPIQDRFLKMRLINNCFTGTDAVDILIHELDCGRMRVALPKINIMTHFALCNGSKSSPPIRSYSPEGVDVELKSATRAFFQRDGIMVDLGTRTIYLSKIFKWFSVDFGQWNEMLNWITFYVDATKAGMLSHLLNTSGPIEVVYQNYDWSSNS